MESEEPPFRYAHRGDKRSAAHMDLDGSVSPTWSHQPRPPIHLPRTNEMLTVHPRRFQGDGYDYRRPVVSANNVIDLTDESTAPSMAPTPPPQPGRSARPPRFGREIIHVVEEHSSGPAEPPDSPEIQFVSSRRIEPAQRRNLTPLAQDDGDEDEVEFLRANPLPETRRRRDVGADLSDLLGAAPRLRTRMEFLARQRRMMEATAARMQAARVQHMFHAGRNPRQDRALSAAGAGLAQGGFIAPAINFRAVGFNLGYDDDEAEAATPAPTYDAPSKAPNGFTRSPHEDEVLICPNCEQELCIGGSDQKRQVWLVKSCGHVYCGECTMNRHQKRSTKGKEKQAPTHTKPFKECVVEGCGKRVSGKNAVIQIFL